jgi:transposase
MSTPACLGVDVSKGYADFLLINEEKIPFEKTFQLDDTREGHQLLEGLLQRFRNVYDISMISCGMESTGGFENNWYEFLHGLSQRFPIRVSRINPKAIKAHRDANLQRNITDAESARAIAEYLIDHEAKVDYGQGGSTSYNTYRSFHRAIQLQIKQQVQLRNQLKQLLYSIFPEILLYCRRSIPAWVLEVLCKYPSAEKIAAQSVKRLVRLRNVTEGKAIALRTKAANSIASRTDSGYDYLIVSMATQLLEMEERIALHKRHLVDHCTGQEVALVKSVPGFGDYTAAVTMIEIEDHNRFEDVKHLASYFGMHPVLKSSGDKVAYRLSKQGRPALRASLYMAALSAVRSDDHVRACYHRLRSKGKHHNTTLVAIMHKLLRIVYGVLRSGIPYDAARDKANMRKQEKTNPPEEQHRKTLASKRRYQRMAVEAPITRKQCKQRQDHLKSSSVADGKNQDRSPLAADGKNEIGDDGARSKANRSEDANSRNTEEGQHPSQSGVPDMHGIRNAVPPPRNL